MAKYDKYVAVGNCTRDLVIDRCVKCDMKMYRVRDATRRAYCAYCEQIWRGKE